MCGFPVLLASHSRRTRKINRQYAAHPTFLHGHAKQMVHMGHCQLMMCHNQKASPCFCYHVTKQSTEAPDIGIVKRCINFVEDANGGWVTAKDGKNQ